MASEQHGIPTSWLIRVEELPPAPGTDTKPVSIRVVYACPHCEYPLRIRAEYFGSTLVCKHCEQTFVPSLAHAVSSLPGQPRGANRGDRKSPASRAALP